MANLAVEVVVVYQPIGQRLIISERTVEVHTKQIFNKLGLLDSHVGNRRVLAFLDEIPRRRPEPR